MGVLVVVGHSARLEHIVSDYTVFTMAGYTAVLPPFAVVVQTMDMT